MRDSWSVHQLVEFLAAVTDESDEDQALRRAVELASEFLGGELGAVLLGGTVRATVGFGGGPIPTAVLETLSAGIWTGELDQLGTVHMAVSEMLNAEDRLLVGRLAEDLTAAERNLLGGMARVLGLALRTLRNLASERELRSAHELLAEERLRSVQSLQGHQQLLETLLNLQRSISHRAPLCEILAAGTSGASKLLAQPVWTFLERSRPTTAASGQPSSFEMYGPPGTSRQGALEAARKALETARALDDARPRELFRFGEAPREAPLGPPARYVVSTVHVGGSATGILIAEATPERGWDNQDQRLLVTFAEHLSMALTDARTVAAVDEAFRDPLTDLPNRALFLDRVEQALADAAGEREEVAVSFIDLDRFKAVNDSLGHAAGDELIKKVAARLAGCLRQGAIAGRFGGDEFAVLLERGAGKQEASALAERIIERLSEAFSLGSSTVVVGASIGIAFGGATVRDAQDLLRNADLAMYRAKKGGRAGWALFEHQMYVEVKERVELEAELQAAVPGSQLFLEYQPVVRLTDETIVGAAAIVHWVHPERGRIDPSVFLLLAEETGVIVEIGRWALDEVLRQLASWLSANDSLRVFVHLSPRQLHDASLTDEIDAALSRNEVPPRLVTFTISEVVLRGADDAVTTRIKALKALGVSLAVDDFGGGMSSLGYLRELPIDILRIDSSFVEGIDADAEAGILASGILASGIVELGSALGLSSMARGIETAGQLARLRSASCQLGQGAYFSAPLDPEHFAALLDLEPAVG